MKIIVEIEILRVSSSDKLNLYEYGELARRAVNNKLGDMLPYNVSFKTYSYVENEK